MSEYGKASKAAAQEIRSWVAAAANAPDEPTVAGAYHMAIEAARREGALYMADKLWALFRWEQQDMVRQVVVHALDNLPETDS